jgi:hypothetical protein
VHLSTHFRKIAPGHYNIKQGGTVPWYAFLLDKILLKKDGFSFFSIEKASVSF